MVISTDYTTMHGSMNIKFKCVLVGKPEGERPFERPRHRWEDNIKMVFQEMECAGMAWIDLAQDRDRGRALVNAVIRAFVSQKNAGNFLTS